MKTSLLQSNLRFSKFVLTAFLMAAFAVASYAQTTYTWNGGGGVWTTAGNWTPTRTTPANTDILQFNTGGTFTVTAVPTQTIGKLLVTGNTNVTLQATAPTKTLFINGPVGGVNLSVANGSELQVNSVNLAYTPMANQQTVVDGTLTVGSGSGISYTMTATTTIDTLRMLSGSQYTATNSVTTINGALIQDGGTFNSIATNLYMGAGLVYNHTANGGQVPTATWPTTTQLNFTGVVDQNITGLSGQTVGAVIWNCPGQTANVLFGLTNATTVYGFTVVNTGGQALSIASANGNFTVNGNFLVQNTSIVDLNTSANSPSVNLYGDLNIASGATLTRSNIAGVTTIIFIGAANKNIYADGTIVPTRLHYSINSGGSTTLHNNLTLGDNMSFTVANGGVLYLGENIISGGTGTSFTLGNNANTILGIGHPQGIVTVADGNFGNIQTATRTFNNARYIYNGSAAQVTGTALPSSNSGTLIK